MSTVASTLRRGVCQLIYELCMEYSIERWVDGGSRDRLAFRQAVHVILQAISGSEYLKPKMIMKGGMLLGIRYQSTRYTEDIDFSTSLKLSDIDQDVFKGELNEQMALAIEDLGYNISCSVQSLTVQPRGGNATFPSFRLKIGYADISNQSEMNRLRSGQAPNTVKIDYSLNEVTCKTEEITLEDGGVIAYHVTDLIAEKLRSILQQPIRNRNRRQDVFDLHFIITSASNISVEEKMDILDSLFRKSDGKVPVDQITIDSLNQDNVRTMSLNEYELLRDEIDGELPDPDVAYGAVVDFYRSLPWDYFRR